MTDGCAAQQSCALGDLGGLEAIILGNGDLDTKDDATSLPVAALQLIVTARERWAAANWGGRLTAARCAWPAQVNVGLWCPSLLGRLLTVLCLVGKAKVETIVDLGEGLLIRSGRVGLVQVFGKGSQLSWRVSGLVVGKVLCLLGVVGTVTVVGAGHDGRRAVDIHGRVQTEGIPLDTCVAV